LSRPFARGADARVAELDALGGRPLAVPAAVRELLVGDAALLVEIHAPAGYVAEPHVHDHESLVYVVEGEVRATVAGETCDLGPGDAVLHGAGTAHAMEVLDAARWVEGKVPPRRTWPAPAVE